MATLMLALAFWALPAALPASADGAYLVPEKTGPPVRLTARAVFLRLPAAIFENTATGLSESEKREILAQGATDQWALRAVTPDMLELESLRDDNVIVRLYLLRGKGDTVAALGMNAGPICLSELWLLGVRGEAQPLEAPPEPHLWDYFSPGTRLPQDIAVTSSLCARPEGLEAQPLFWTSIGKADVMPDNAVFYIWTGSRFSKRIVSLFDPGQAGGADPSK